MNSIERMIYDKYAYDETFYYIFKVYMEFERRVNATVEYEGLKYGECRCDLKKWQIRLKISEKQLRRALKDLIEDGVIKRTFKGVKGKGVSIYLLTRFEGTNKDTNKDSNKGTNKLSDCNALDIFEDTNKGSNKDTKKGNTSKNNNLRIISKEIYIDIFNYWNTGSGVNHKELKEPMIKAMEKAMKKYKDIKIIKLAISNYDEILKSGYYYSHKFTLEKFLKQSNGISEFLEEGSVLENYREYKQQLKGQQNSSLEGVNELKGRIKTVVGRAD